MEIKYLIEAKFIKEISKVLVDHFKYRVALSPEQFIQSGYTERKMVLVLDLYDLVKQVRNMAKVGERLTMKDTKWEHPCDQAVKHYSVVDHTKGLQRQMQFNMNAALLKSNVTCQKTRSTVATANENDGGEMQTVESERQVTDLRNSLCCPPAGAK